jgi:hypothetical protein
MRPMLGMGVVVFALGLVLAALGIVQVGGEFSAVGSSVPSPTSDAQSTGWYLLIAVVAGLALASGALLIGLSFGNWRHPRTHLEPGDEIVDPEGYHKMKHV